MLENFFYIIGLENRLPEQILLFIFALSFLIQFFYYAVFYSRIFFLKRKKTTDRVPQEPVSVIICAKNEAENLKKNLPQVLTQNYPDYEVIVVNDSSGDNTLETLALLKQKYPKLYFTSLHRTEAYKRGKKLAQTIGIKAAKNDCLIFTDADCIPESKNWLSSMQSRFDKQTEIVLAYGGYKAAKGLINRFIRFDTLFIALQYFTFARAGFPYMGVGRNLAYRKSLFNKNKGFAGHIYIASGDDDLFVNQAATKKNTAVTIDSESFTRSEAKQTWREWKFQKTRHFSTAKRYKRKHQLLLLGEISSRMVFYLSFFALMAMQTLPMWVAIIFAVRFLFQEIVFFFAARQLKEKGIYIFGVLFDLLLPIINFYFAVSNLYYRMRE